MKRVSELHAMSVSKLCLRWLLDDCRVVPRPNPSFLPKVLLSQFINQHIELASFQTSGPDPSAQLLCPVCVLNFCVNSTAQFRQSSYLYVTLTLTKLEMHVQYKVLRTSGAWTYISGIGV